ncbi:MAG TPA: OmpA family protein [Bacteroidales bacterium]|nr:OmpA family protein [Bacteroidales bacterium]
MQNVHILLIAALSFIALPGFSQEEEENSDAQPQEKVQIQSTTKYDFVPGDKVLFYEDFSQDAIGDFPALWTTDGTGEVREVSSYPGHWLYAPSNEHVYCLMKNLEIPGNFIFEFDVIPTPSNPDEDDTHASFEVTFYKTEGDYLLNEIVPGDAGFHVIATTESWGAAGFKDQEYISDLSSVAAPVKINKLNHVIIWVQNRRLRVYHEGQKIIDGPTALPAGESFNRFRISMWGQTGYPFFTNLKITTAAPDMRSKLLTEGKLISYGIYFDSGKDVVKSESYGTLSEIAKVLSENAAVRIKITGHTDSDGNDALNLDLSKRRAASVKTELVKQFGIDAGRIETDGKGESEPISPNSTPEGKAKNRRVEFIKL